MIGVVYFFTRLSIRENTDGRNKDARVRTNGLRAMYSTIEEFFKKRFMLKNAYLVLLCDLLSFLFIQKHHIDCL